MQRVPCLRRHRPLPTTLPQSAIRNPQSAIRNSNMPFLSELLNKTVYDSRNEAVGKCVDVYVNPDEKFPAVAAIGLHRGGQEYLLSALDLARMDQGGIVCTGRLRDLTLYEPK